MDKSLIILRGLPGSGKSTLVTILAEEKYPALSIDDYFINEKGEYVFEFEKNHLAYKACEQNTLKFMHQNVPKIFLHNVFSMDWEIEPYFKMAAEHGYRIFVLTVENRHGNTNIHEIPDEQVQKMAAKFKVIINPL